MTPFDRERALDEAFGTELDLDAYDARCGSCGAFYQPPTPVECALCGSADLSPVEDRLAW